MSIFTLQEAPLNVYWVSSSLQTSSETHVQSIAKDAWKMFVVFYHSRKSLAPSTRFYLYKRPEMECGCVSNLSGLELLNPHFPALLKFKVDPTVLWGEIYSPLSNILSRDAILQAYHYSVASSICKCSNELRSWVPPVQTFTANTMPLPWNWINLVSLCILNVRRKFNAVFSKKCYFVQQTPK